MITNPAIEAGAGRRGPYKRKPTTAIGRLRQQKGLTQPECAKFCRVSLRTFQRAESGDVVDFATKRSIERALGAAW